MYRLPVGIYTFGKELSIEEGKMHEGHNFRCREFLRCFFDVSPCSGTSWFKEYISQISMSNISFPVSEASKNVRGPAARAARGGQGQTFKIQLRDEWLYCSHGMGGMFLKINSGTKQLTIRYQGSFPAPPRRQSLRSRGSGLLRTPTNII